MACAGGADGSRVPASMLSLDAGVKTRKDDASGLVLTGLLIVSDEIIRAVFLA